MKTLTIIGRRWFSPDGNTYHSAHTVVDGVDHVACEFAYGYGNQYEETAAQWLESENMITARKVNPSGSESIRRYCEREGITFSSEVCDVKRKRDL